jgi:antitoxin component of RelBE/YafQ-DinJ toxin-antitoxin module
VSRNPVSIRLSEDALSLIQQLVESLGVTRTAVVEMSVRALAREHKIKTKP